jgi:predicted transcriptional regulator
MTEFNEVLTYINNHLEAAAGLKLSGHEVALLEAAWFGQNYDVVSARTGLRRDNIRCNVARQLWVKLTATLQPGQKFNKKNFAKLIETVMYPGSDASVLKVTSPVFLIDPLPSLEGFVGRNREISEISALLELNRVVQVFGIKGIGKSSVAAKIFERKTQSKYASCIWIQAYPDMNFPKFMSVLMNALQDYFEEDINIDEDRITALIRILSEEKFFIAVENAHYLEDRWDGELNSFSSLIAKLSIPKTRSSILLMCGTPLTTITHLENVKRPVKSYKLEGLSIIEGTQLLQSKNCYGKYLEQIVINQGGNPAQLIKISERINNYFNGNTEAEMLRLTSIASDFVATQLEDIRIQLSRTEIEVLKALAKKNKLSIAELIKSTNLSSSEVLSAVEKLINKSLISVSNKSEIVQVEMLKSIQHYTLNNLAS